MDVRMPDGVVIKNVPDNITQDELTARYSAYKAPREDTGVKAMQIPTGIVEAGSSLASGAVSAPLSGLAGIAQAGANAVGLGSTPAADRVRQVQEKFTYQPITDAGKSIVGAVAYPFEKLAQGADVVGGKAAEVTGSPALGAAINAGIQVGVPLALAKGIAAAPKRAGFVDKIVPGAAAAGKEVGAAVSEAVMPRPEVARLAYKAQALDIPLRPDMLSDNRFLRMMGEAFERIPLSGSRADARQVAFNRALINQIGGDKMAQRLTPDVFDSAMNKSGGTIGRIAEKSPLILDKEAVSSLESIVSDSNKFNTADVSKIISNYVDEIKSKTNGSAIRNIDSKIGAQIRSTSNGDLRLALSGLQEELRSLVGRNVSAEDAAAWSDARRQYAIGKEIEPLVAKATRGDISPSGLMGAVTNTGSRKSFMARGGGEMGDLARIGQLFLKEPASSGTAERGLVYGGLLGGGAMVEPATATTIYGAANAYNRAGPAIVRKIVRNAPQE